MCQRESCKSRRARALPPPREQRLAARRQLPGRRRQRRSRGGDRQHDGTLTTTPDSMTLDSPLLSRVLTVVGSIIDKNRPALTSDAGSQHEDNYTIAAVLLTVLDTKLMSN